MTPPSAAIDAIQEARAVGTFEEASIKADLANQTLNTQAQRT